MAVRRGCSPPGSAWRSLRAMGSVPSALVRVAVGVEHERARPRGYELRDAPERLGVVEGALGLGVEDRVDVTGCRLPLGQQAATRRLGRHDRHGDAELLHARWQVATQPVRHARR